MYRDGDVGQLRMHGDTVINSISRFDNASWASFQRRFSSSSYQLSSAFSSPEFCGSWRPRGPRPDNGGIFRQCACHLLIFQGIHLVFPFHASIGHIETNLSFISVIMKVDTSRACWNHKHHDRNQATKRKHVERAPSLTRTRSSTKIKAI